MRSSLVWGLGKFGVLVGDLDDRVIDFGLLLVLELRELMFGKPVESFGCRYLCG
jgi:hypothetical protein